MSRLALALILSTVASSAEAHTGIGDINGILAGFSHPISGLDHVLAMIAVGLFAAHLGGRALWLVPLSLVSMMIVGGALGVAGIGFPSVELGIALSVIVLGSAIAFRVHLPITAAMAMVGFFALFHGHAHGAEMPASASAMEYGFGFLLATAALLALGIAVSLLIGRTGLSFGYRVVQGTGGAMAVAGLAILAGYI